MAPNTKEDAPPIIRARASLRTPRLDRLTRDGLRQYVLGAWALTEWLFSGLVDDEVLSRRPDPLRNPLIFYLGHPAAFTLNKLKLAGLVDVPVDTVLQQVLAVGVDPATTADLDGSVLWPSAAEVHAFRARALEVVLAVVERIALDEPVTWTSPPWALLMGVEHELIHFETSSVLIRQLPLDQVSPPSHWSIAPHTDRTPDNPPVPFDGGTISLGRPESLRTYGWDNEYGHREVQVGPFALSRQLVSNAELLEFVEAGGYRNQRYWSKPAWSWLQAEDRARPFFWKRRDDQLFLRTVFRELPLPLDWPAEVNHYEASAFCAWRNARLPSEAELVLARDDMARLDGDAGDHPDHHLGLATCSPRAVDAGQPTPRGLHDPVGNVWQWLADDFRPLPGFRAHPLYPDFSRPYFDPDHPALRGGSWASTGESASEHYRLWFRPYFYQHAGFRLAWDR